MLKKITFLLFIFASLLSAQNFYIGDNANTCSPCHTPAIDQWAQTKHAIAQDSLSFLQLECLKCHNTGWDETITNYGADEYVVADTAAPFGWVVTDQENWDKVKNIQCETCHGALGKEDRSRVDSHSSKAIIDLSADVCGSCHEGSHHPTFSNWNESLHAKSKFTTIPGAFEWIASDPNCSACHTAEGFLQFLESNAIEPQVEAPGAAGNDITCSACHDPHGGPFEGQLRLEPSALCQKCHNPEYNPDETFEPDGNAVHHSTAWMLEGKGGYEYEGFSYESSIHNLVAQKKCVTCHVVTTPFESEEIPAFTGHTFEPKSLICVDCHSTIDPDANNFDYHGVQTEIDSLLTVLGDKLATASSSDSSSNDFYRALFNFDFVSADGSHGVHNTKYARGLLVSALENFNPTSVAKTDLLPTNYNLEQNYPNPFNPTTVINFSIPKAGDVKLAIYDALGREVEMLLDKKLDAGNYDADWNATNYAAGIYFYSITVNDFVSTKKMVLLK